MTQKYIADPVRQLLELIPDAGAPRRVIGLVGLPGAGKSTQARLWSEQVNLRAAGLPGRSASTAPAMQSLGMDGFHLSRQDLARLPPPQNDMARRGAPWTFDAAGLAGRLQALRQPGTADTGLNDGARRADGQQQVLLWPDFDHGVGDPVADAIGIAPATRLVLVEGLYLLLNEPGWNLKRYFDQVWFLDESLQTASARLVQRHCRSWNISTDEATQRVAVNDLLNARICDQTRGFADALVAPMPLGKD